MSYDHKFHLSKRLGITPPDYEFLLVAADLALFHKKYGFSIKLMKWKVFLEGHRFTTINCDRVFEVDEKKVDLNSLSRRAALLLSCRVSWLSYHLLSYFLVGIDAVRTPDLGQGGAHAGGVALG
jgi:hypothetical protein